MDAGISDIHFVYHRMKLNAYKDPLYCIDASYWENTLQDMESCRSKITTRNITNMFAYMI